MTMMLGKSLGLPRQECGGPDSIPGLGQGSQRSWVFFPTESTLFRSSGSAFVVWWSTPDSEDFKVGTYFF